VEKVRSSAKLLGTFNYATKARYEGQWTDSMKDGKGNALKSIIGVYYYPNGDKLEGEWKKNRLDGKGLLS
jgi:hypothetical protein